MPHDTGLMATVAVGLTAAFAAALIVMRIGLPPIVGYLLAGVAIGPFTPGFVADAALAPQLAEIGVILLLFGVGIHFSPGDLLAVRGIALPGAVGQITFTTLVGLGAASLWGWTTGEGLVFGLALSVASTVVLLRALEARDEVQTGAGRTAIGWLLAQDLAMVMVLVLLPIFAGQLGGVTAGDGEVDLLPTLASTFGKIAAFALLMLVVGARFIPWLLRQVRGMESRELFVLAVLATALGIAYGGAEIFGISFALGAFVAGLVVGQSETGHDAEVEIAPLRDAFLVLFFVSVGMLVDPAFLFDAPGQIALVVAIIVLGNGLAALTLVTMLRGQRRTALTVAAGLTQIGEFSFIVAQVGRSLDLLPVEGYNLILAGALVSITFNPVVFRSADMLAARRSIPAAG